MSAFDTLTLKVSTHCTSCGAQLAVMCSPLVSPAESIVRRLLLRRHHLRTTPGVRR